jgi:FkbM family methyltransferase
MDLNLKQYPPYNELRHIYPLRLEMLGLVQSRRRKLRVAAIATLMLFKHWLPHKWRRRPVQLPVDGWDPVWVTDRSEYRVAHEVFLRRIYDLPGLPDDAETILDLGANVGLAARFFAERYPTARIICYEADPIVAARAQRNLCHLPQVEIRVAAITGHTGKVTLHREARDSWGTGEHAQGEPFETQAKSLEDTLAEFESIDVLKLDIEGSEYQAIDRCGNLELARVIVGELHEVEGRSFDAFFDRLEGFALIEKDLEYGNCTFVAARRSQ